MIITIEPPFPPPPQLQLAEDAVGTHQALLLSHRGEVKPWWEALLEDITGREQRAVEQQLKLEQKGKGA
jgi:hypothetical protein